jgi:DNA end-binding protein Ku
MTGVCDKKEVKVAEGKSMFKGAISLGGSVLIPMRIVKATSQHDVRFHEYHKCPDGQVGRVGRQKPCKVCGAVLSEADITKGIEVSKGSIVSFTKDEMANLPLKSTREIEVERFVGAEEINPLIIDETYYVLPDDKLGIKAFELFVRGLKKQRKVAIGKITIAQREHICAISAMGNSMLLNTLHWSDEIREMPQPPKTDVVDDEVELISQVINKYSKPFDHTVYVDEYTDAVQTMIDAKLKGEALPTAPAAQVKETANLKDALTDLLNKP